MQCRCLASDKVNEIWDTEAVVKKMCCTGSAVCQNETVTENARCCRTCLAQSVPVLVERNTAQCTAFVGIVHWFGLMTTALVTSTKLSYVEPGQYWDLRPLAGLPSLYLSRPLRSTQPGHPSVGRCN